MVLTRPWMAILLVPLLLWTVPGSPGFAASGAGPIAVVASIRPVHSLVAGVMAGVGAPELLVRGRASPHEYSLRPTEARLLAHARLVFWVGPGLEAFLVQSLSLLPPEGRAVALGEGEGLQQWPNRPGGVWAGEQAGSARDEEKPSHREGGKDGEEPHRGADKEHGRNNPHVWLDPSNARAMVTRIAEALAEADPPRAAIYRRNAQATAGRLSELERKLTARLKPVRGRPFVVLHDAFAHFEHRFGLKALGAMTLAPGQGPGARRMVQLRKAMAREAPGGACIFSEPSSGERLAKLLAEDTGARLGTLDPLGVELTPGAGLYFQLLDRIADAFIGCLAAS